jgi:hypothetical protein
MVEDALGLKLYQHKKAESERKRAEQEQRAKERREGEERLRKMEGEVPWYRRALRDYGEIAGQVVQFLPKESDFHFDLAGQVRSIVTRNITADEADSIVRNGGLMLVAEGVVKARELLGSCDEKQIGNIAALIKSVNEVVNLRNGKATKITAKEQPAGKSFAELRAEAQASLKKKEPERIIDVSEMVDVPELEEVMEEDE